jgi:hypothetical protein
MHTDEVVVVIAAVVAIAWVNWYFFVAARRPADRPGRRQRDGAART